MGSLLQSEPAALTQQELVSQNKVSTVYIHKCDLAGGSKPKNMSSSVGLPIPNWMEIPDL